MFNQGVKSTEWGKEGCFSKLCRSNWVSTLKKNEPPSLHLTPYTKINFSCIIDLNIKARIIKLLKAQDNIFMPLSS